MRPQMLLTALFAVALGCSADQVTTVIPDTTDVGPVHSGFNVTVDGSSTGDGSSAHPWSLATALAQPGIVKPGDTIWVHGGTYAGEFTSNLTGTVTAPIVLRQFPGERATIDGKLSIVGQYAYYWGLEIMYSDTKRVTSLAGSDPADLPRERMTVFVTGPFNKLINLVIHDLGDGLFSGVSGQGIEVYGSVIYNNGWLGPDRGHGHSVYLQNRDATKVVRDNVWFGSFSSGLHIYGSDATWLQNFDIQGNTMFNSGDHVTPEVEIEYWGGAIGSLHNAVYKQNSIYHRDGGSQVVHLNAAGNPAGEDVEFSGNIVNGTVGFNEMKHYVVTGNKFTSGTTPLGGQSVLIGLRVPAGVTYSSYVWNSNQYAVPANSTQDPFYVVNGFGATYKFPAWQTATGYDGLGAYVSGGFPQADIVVRNNQYEPGRAFITCWNWNGAAELNVDLSAVLKSGESFEIRHIFDLFGTPIVKGVFSGSSVSIPQPRLAPPAPLGYAQPGIMPDNRFNVFLVTRVK